MSSRVTRQRHREVVPYSEMVSGFPVEMSDRDQDREGSGRVMGERSKKATLLFCVREGRKKT